MILIDLSNTINKLWEKISFHKHFIELYISLALPLHLQDCLVDKRQSYCLGRIFA